MEKTKSKIWKPKWSSEDQQDVARIATDIRDGVSALKAMRDMLGLSQADLAKLLKTTQSNVSKLEAKSDIRISSLRQIVESRGGALRIIAEIDGKVLELPI